MSDIVERLRFCAEHGMYDAHLKGMFVSYDEAAVEIEKLRKDVGVWINATADEKLVSKALREKNEELDANYKSAFQMLSNQARTIRRLSEENEKLREALIDTLSSLVASVDLLERGGKKAAPSDKMFAQMLVDYKNSIERGRSAAAALKEPGDD